MKICVAQTRSIKGNIQANIAGHKKIILEAISHQADMIIFPELSLTGYEPTLAKTLATTKDDSRFDEFQAISDSKNICIGVGAPLKNNGGVSIGMIIFQPNQARQVYFKKFLHSDEDEFFVTGEGISGLTIKNTNIALAICYEISVPEHAENAYNSGAHFYVASVAKFVNGIDKALSTLSETARKYSMVVLMPNCVGEADGARCAGKTSVWNSNGSIIDPLNDTDEGLLILDTATQIVTKHELTAATTR